MTEAVSIGPFSFIDSNSTVKQVKRKDVAWGRKDMLKYAIFLNYAALYELIPQKNDNKWSFFSQHFHLPSEQKPKSVQNSSLNNAKDS